MRIALLEPYYSGSHKRWADDLKRLSRYHVDLFTMPGRFWKWRMQGAAVNLADMMQMHYRDNPPEIILCSSMMDVSLFRALLAPHLRNIPVIYYMHESQLSYPGSPNDTHVYDQQYHYGFINFKSCLASDHVAFNSAWHRDKFLDDIKALLERLPDYSLIDHISSIREKSVILPVGIDFALIDRTISGISYPDAEAPSLLWNHRWEYDKKPALFLELCLKLAKQHTFNIHILGDSINNITGMPATRDKLKSLEPFIKTLGYLDSFTDYLSTLKYSSIIPVTSGHDFFGISVIEAVYCGVYPVLPAGMVYNEHFGYDFHLYYNNPEELYALTSEALQRAETGQLAPLPVKQRLHERYEISEVIGRYDSLFESCI